MDLHQPLQKSHQDVSQSPELQPSPDTPLQLYQAIHHTRIHPPEQSTRQILQLQRHLGNRATARLLSSPSHTTLMRQARSPVNVNFMNMTPINEGANGEFGWWVNFSVSGGQQGWLVQEMINTFDAVDHHGRPITSHGIVPHYWEAWYVTQDGMITPMRGMSHDHWIRRGWDEGSKGSWSMRGRVYFTTDPLERQGFAQGRVSNAGDLLYSSLTPPRHPGRVLLERTASGAWEARGAHVIRTTP